MSYIGNTNTTQGFVPAVDYFNGNGSTTAFTLSRPVASVAQVQAVIENVPQNPGSAFTVSGSTITFTSAPPSGTSNIYVYYTSPNTQVIQPGQGTVGTAQLAGGLAFSQWTTTGSDIYYNTGNVGIGLSPSQKLHVQGNSLVIPAAGWSSGQTANMYIGDSGNGWSSTFGGLNTLAGYYGFAFTTTGTERARIDSSGNFMVSCTSYPYVSTGGSPFGIGLSADDHIDIITDGASSLNLRRDNSDGTTQSFRRGTTVVGSINVTSSATSYVTSSDYRLKNSVAPMTGALAKVAALKPVTYKWNVDDSEGEGFIAHELAEVCPQAVHGEKDAVDADGNPEYQGIDTSFLVATLTAAIQELKADLDATKAELAALKGPQ